VQKAARELRFIEPMECLDVDVVSEGKEWLYEIKHDGYRAIAIKQNNEVQLLSRKGKLLSQFPNLFPDLLKLSPKSFILDGEAVAIDGSGKQSFSILQNVRSNKAQVSFYAFDVLHLNGEDLLTRPLSERRKILESTFTKLPEHVRISPILKGTAKLVTAKLRELEFEGIVAKRSDSIYEPGKRGGAWQKHKTQRSDEFVIGGYIGLNNVDELVVGEQRDGKWFFVESVKNGFVPATRHSSYKAIEKLRADKCPFVNLPEKKGEHNFDKEKMKEAHWVKPRVVVEIAFNERTPLGHLRHSRFLRLRADKSADEIDR
jgi:DNA ligase D-like protein (predicted ligase)